MNWKHITNPGHITQINEESKQQNVLIFKHSTRCSISDAALGRLERNWKDENLNQLSCYYLDLIQYRDLSDLISKTYGIHHESPQALIIKDGKCVFSQTHSQIRLSELLQA
ncbi:MAG: bacillithiol system redox-active protein YtxJ [Bacteroidia bacterium]|jgi:bacillithiol system protein YtxJ|nr:bacillithiol system redox-active protein YtxJ [Bacteroidia bacterium]